MTEPPYSSKLPKARRLKNPRNPFPHDPFFPVPLRLYDIGLVPVLSGSAFKRYMTLLRCANYNYASREVQYSYKDLEKMDGVAGRTARDVDTKLQEYGLISIKKTSPYTYTLTLPSAWENVATRNFPDHDAARQTTYKSRNRPQKPEPARITDIPNPWKTAAG